MGREGGGGKMIWLTEKGWEAAVHMRETEGIAVTYEPHLYEVIFAHEGV